MFKLVMNKKQSNFVLKFNDKFRFKNGQVCEKRQKNLLSVVIRN